VVTTAHEAARCLGAELDALLLALPQGARSAWLNVGDASEASVVECLRSFLWENLATASIESAARAAGTSKRSLQRSLKESGTTFRELVWETRLERTKQLLAETDLKLLAVSLSIGLQKPQQLRQFFLKRVGKTPREFRKAARIAALVASQTRARDAERSAPTGSGFFPSRA
jgi:AraC-like DNA-binding protein